MLGHPLVVFVVLVGGLGDVLHVGSSVLGRLVGLGGLVRSSFLFCSRRSASSVAVCFRWTFFSFFSIVSPLCACAGQLLFDLHQVVSVICFPLNKIRAKARSRKRQEPGTGAFGSFSSLKARSSNKQQAT